MPIALRQAEVVCDGTLAGGAADLRPVSNALRGNVEITVHDEVDDG